ncbi:MAG: S8 family serine peptidase [Solirubrobacteraceae bacterium]
MTEPRTFLLAPALLIALVIATMASLSGSMAGARTSTPHRASTAHRRSVVHRAPTETARAPLGAALKPVLRALVVPRGAVDWLGASRVAPELSAAESGARSASLPPAYVPGEVIVGYTPAANLTADALGVGVRHSTQAPAPHSRLLRLPRGESVSSAIARLRHEPGVAYAEPNYIAHAAGQFFPDDPGRARHLHGWEQMQWNLLAADGINAPQAWDNLLGDHRGGGRRVVVAVLDTGVAYRNYKQFHKSPDFGGAHFVDPYDFVAHNRYPLDRNGHGTFVASVIAESTNNGIGLTGIAYGAAIMPVRVLNASGEGDETTIAQGIRYAVRHGAQVINLSLEFLPSQVSSAGEIPQIVSAIEYARRRGVTVVGAAGNDQTDEIAYPARAPGVISVGATTRDRCLADYSNGGSGLDLVAPGGGDDAILSSDPDCHPNRNLPSIYQLTLSDPPHWGRFGYPGYYIGTSMASPEVAATVALIIASRVIGPHPTPDQILSRLEETATQLPVAGPRPNPTYGYGLLDAGAATDRHFVPSSSGTPTTTTTTTTTTSTTPASTTPTSTTPTSTNASSTTAPTSPLRQPPSILTP